MTQPFYYWVKIIDLAGANVAAPLDIASVTFTQNIYVPGQHRPGKATIYLLNSHGSPYLRATYALLKAMQRVEIYDNRDLLGDPQWTGFLTRKTRDLSGNYQWQCLSVEALLDLRHLRQYHRLTGNVATVVASLLKTYNAVFTDDFTDLTGWTNDHWAASGGIASVTLSSGGNSDATMTTTTTYTAAQMDNAEINLLFKLTYPTGSDPVFTVMFPQSAGTRRGEISISPITSTAVQLLVYDVTTGDAAETLAYRNIDWNYSAWAHVRIVTTVSGGQRRIILLVNGVEMIDVTDTNTACSHTGTVELYALNSEAVAATFYVDKFIVAPATSVLSLGNIDASATTVDRIFNGDSQLSVIEDLCEAEGWEYRIRPKAGAGNDLIDFGAQIGYDYSTAPNLITLSDGTSEGRIANIESLDVDDSNEGLATRLVVYGQSRDDTTSGFICDDISAIGTYGIIEDEYHDERMLDSATAKAIGDVRLARLSAGNISISGRILDESYLLEQTPIIGYAVIGDAIIGGRKRFRAGDLVWLKSDDFGLNKAIEFVSITRTSGDVAIDFVADYHRWQQSDDERILRREVRALQRAFMQRMNSQSWQLTLEHGVWYDLNFHLRGQIQATYIDVRIQSGTGVQLSTREDGVEHTSFGAPAGGWTDDFYIKDTIYFVSSGEHSLGFYSNGAGTVVINVALTTELLA